MTAPRPNQKILIVDDDQAHCTLTRRALKDTILSMELIEAHSCDEAFEILKHASADLRLVILDLRLGSCSGLEVLARIRSQYDHSALPVVVVSTSSVETDFLDSYRAGANSFVVKDTDPVGFRNCLRKAVKFFLR